MLEGWRRIEAAIANVGACPEALSARAELAAGIQGNFLAQYDASNAYLARAIERADAPDLELIRAQALDWRGMNALRQGFTAEARAYLERAAEIQRRRNDSWGLSNTLNDIGCVVSDEEGGDDQVNARWYFEQSLELARHAEDRLAQAIALQNLANSYPPGTPIISELIEQSMALKRELGNPGGIANSLHNLGAAALGANDLESAKQYLVQALELYLRVGHR
ncbi:MAG: hypothetical protein HC933_11505, partial [Pleurocapsa sp. SU_196_0]|nr:hypothetical protein [Pleurocapsa sp. SU_196_0]